ncbi:MAG: Eco57I restriction-modification methylase domain-containing protein [Candidatus Solibacter usitatus]|nr:Eco57I restriction-modification methylase domain-containing protein [Candidatus Solibacter usitatus]
MRQAVTAVAEPGALDQVRQEAGRRSNPQRKVALGQFMTPDSVAKFMAGLFSQRTGAIRLLDAGAGIGSLTAAFLHRWGCDDVCATVYEIDGALASYLRETLLAYGGPGFEATIVDRDFIQDAVYKITMGGKGPGFTHAILNPPYKKINSDSVHRALLRVVGLETVNLYTAFVGLAIELMAPGGQIVAIIPRSFCNGPYYKPFREWMLARTSIEHLHLFHSRTSAFNDDEVLQENVIIKLVRGPQQAQVTITTASDTSFSDLQAYDYPFEEIVYDRDEQRFIHVPLAPSHSGPDGVPLAQRSLAEIGLEVSTGPVVDFRLKEYLRENPEEGAIPLLYPSHFVNGRLEWPRRSKKPNALTDHPETRKWLYPMGFYTIVRRFSSKEERRRIVAHVVDPAAFNGDAIGFENHLNVFHSGKQGMDRDVAHGLAVFLNSTAVDNYFRRFSGHTQVNATDLRLLRYPGRRDLEELGRWAQGQRRPAQEQVDQQVAKLNDRGK